MECATDAGVSTHRSFGDHREEPGSVTSALATRASAVGPLRAFAYGNRYAPDQFESRVPVDLGPTNVAAAGGVAGDVVSSHLAMEAPTEIVPLGLLVDAEGVVSLRRYAPLTVMPAEDTHVQPRIGAPPVIAVLGTSMNSAKTTTVAAIVRGLSAARLDVAAGKVTGTGAGGDPRLFEDSGAAAAMDFTRFGFASTYRLGRGEIRDIFASMVRESTASGPDVIVLEIAVVLDNIDADLGSDVREMLRAVLADYPGVVLLASDEPERVVSQCRVWSPDTAVSRRDAAAS